MHHVEPREILGSIILSILTCGIYSLYWFYKLLSDLYAINNMPNKAGRDLLLSMVTLGIYFFYISYQMGELEHDALAKHKLYARDNSALYLVLSLIGYSIISFAIIQSKLNEELGNAHNKAEFERQRNNGHQNHQQ